MPVLVGRGDREAQEADAGYVFAPPPISRTRWEARIVGTARLGREATIESGPRPTLSLAEVKPRR